MTTPEELVGRTRGRRWLPPRLFSAGRLSNQIGSLIDVTVPVFGEPTTLSVRDNFAVAKDEIEELQGRVAALELTPPTGVPEAPATGEIFGRGQVSGVQTWTPVLPIDGPIDGGTF